MTRRFFIALPADPVYRRSFLAVFLLVAMLNIGAWTWALLVFHGQPVLIGVAVVVYGLGLRHAVDADHIAAIDNITRKLLQDGRRSASIGFWFAIGHSAVILLATAALVAAAGNFSRLQGFREIGGIVSTAVSGLFLLLVAAMNICILLAIVRTVRRVRAGHPIKEQELNTLFSGNGLLFRLLRPVFRRVNRPWQMGLLGFLFGLSFDTASEVALFGISATQAAHGVSLGSTLVFPVLFAAGMALLDTADGVMMVGAYHWAIDDPFRKLYYNMIITMMSIAIALFIGLIQLGTLTARLLGSEYLISIIINRLSENLNYLGLAIVAVFALSWATSVFTFKLIGRRPRFGAVDV